MVCTDGPAEQIGGHPVKAGLVLLNVNSIVSPSNDAFIPALKTKFCLKSDFATIAGRLIGTGGLIVGRYELADSEWERVKEIVTKPERMGRPRRDDRQMLKGISWILCTGATWRDRPERLGPWKMMYDRFRIGRDEGTFDTSLQRRH